MLDDRADQPGDLIHVRGLTRSYRMGRYEVRAVAGVDLTVRRGEFLAVVGVSGSGKSTLLQLLGGLEAPSTGSIRVDGHELSALTSHERALYRRRTVGFVFQAFHLVPSMTALANVALALTLQGIYGMRRENLAREALQRVGLSGRGEHRPTELSGGEQQRVALARALVQRPTLLLADEPTGNLDRHHGAAIIGLIREIQRSDGTTVIMVTHDEAGARQVADRVVRMSDGYLLPEGAAS